jgi:hypothetical protein
MAEILNPETDAYEPFIGPKKNAYIIQLKIDIKNPEPDRRSKDWNKQPVVPQGKRFIVEYNTTLTAVDQRYQWERCNSELGRSILANSEHVEPELIREIKIVDADFDYDGDSILRALLKMGRITRQDFRDVRRFLEASE